MACKNCGKNKTAVQTKTPSETFTRALIDKIVKLINMALPLINVAKTNRPSCLECVEKHLGAAAVLFSEVPDGYSVHRLYAIGHLHEAAEEAAAWPELRETIRAARIAYQQNGTIPDFTQLITLLNNIGETTNG